MALVGNCAKDILKSAMSKIIGQIYKAHSDSFSVMASDKLINCRARGLLKAKGYGLSVGDYVDLENKVITSVHDRKNHFIRPNVSNVDCVIGVFSPEPKPDYYIIDKLYINAIKESAEFIIVVNKNDISRQVFDEIKGEYAELGIKIFSVSSDTLDGVDTLKEFIKGKLSVLAGQSAAGKTSLINAMFGLNLRTGELSEKILRGKHTTTRSEIFECDGVRIVDSPGFAVLDAQVNIKELPECYPEYYEVSSECKFRGCAHVNEPNCKVKELVEKGVFSKERYLRYKEIYDEISKRRTYYEKD